MEKQRIVLIVSTDVDPSRLLDEAHDFAEMLENVLDCAVDIDNDVFVEPVE